MFALGEAMLSPVLTPLAASMAPAGATGRTLAAVSASRTLAGALGPALSGVLISAGVPAAFVTIQLGCCVASAVLLLSLRRHIPGQPAQELPHSPTAADVAGLGAFRRARSR